ncbi:MAG: alpha/beta hydrolase [Chloroflexi bacterium]|nr:alpha/beta hydrolase [Chloroflexota bacterium]
MPSFRSRLVVFMLKNGPRLQFGRQGSGVFDANYIQEFRRKVDHPPKLFGKPPKHIEIEPIQIGELYAEWLRPTGTPHERVLLYFHGGGYVSGTCAAHRMHVAKVVDGSGLPALVFQYRLAPEHPYPAALEDALAAYRWLLGQGTDAARIAFMGDSAGAGLCLATLLAIRDQALPFPAGAVALSPWTDLACTGESYQTRQALDPVTPIDSWTVFSQSYVADNDPTLPWISPLYGNLHDLPPLRMYVGEYEVMHDDSVRFAAKAQAAGVDVRLTVGEKMIHCYPICAPLFPEATAALAEICAFLRARVSDQPERAPVAV